MENLAAEIENFLNKKLELYSELTKILELESSYIVKMDVNALWAASSRKKELALEIQKLRTSLLEYLDEKGIFHGMDARNFSLSCLIGDLPLNRKIKSSLEKFNIALDAKKKELKQQALSNRRSIQEHLGVIDGVMSTITGARAHKSYGHKGVSGVTPSFYGTRYGRGASTSLLSARV
ncbi:putative flagellar apparatus related protein [Desulfamplus magnetovallimortis]|uniref:Putative flagellar apparatus related protein n=1 Tax=Desulfamplus magnetovallimortis TaxID=1246637 RepID=A0A1W1HA10_9BACT|nr:flagellar protein FlgN [Desulfamplus magnetovallimortis]SLM29218.1 putative flagellar apparatus related protein [Desulfamplus magnetovallimortis]